MRRINAAITKISLLGSVALLVSGCVPSQPVPTDVGGRYYMAGDPQCVTFRKRGSKIVCRDKEGRVTGTRRAMTNQELLMYTHREQMRLMEDIEMQIMMNRTVAPWWSPWGW